MPVDSHLQWAEIRDFTPGLYTDWDQLMPPSAAQVMTDCFPVPSGGLRAWYKPTAFPTTGVVSTTNESPRALFVHELLANRSGNGTGNDYYLVTYDTVSTFTRIYRMDQTAAGPPVTWSLIKTTVAGLDPSRVVATDYVTSDGNRYVAFAFGAGCGTDNGIWLVRYSDGALTHLLNAQEPIVFNYQSRLCAIGSVSTGVPNTIKFTDPALLTNITLNTAPVDLSEGNGISGVATFSPGDLLCFKSSGSIYLVEGDLTNYTVRQMNGSKPGGGTTVRGPMGVIFLVPNDGVYETPDGSFVTPLSKSIASTSLASGINNIVFVNHWLFAFQGGGLILDTDTRAWFTTSAITTTGVGCRMYQLHGFFVADQVSPFTLSQLAAVDGATTNRAESYTWKSAPLRDPSGKQVEIRAVAIVARSRNGATSTITVTVNGVGQTVACDSSGRGSITFYYMARRETLDVQVTAASNAAGVEAPLIEVVRIGSQAGHYLRTGTDVG